MILAPEVCSLMYRMLFKSDGGSAWRYSHCMEARRGARVMTGVVTGYMDFPLGQRIAETGEGFEVMDYLANGIVPLIALSMCRAGYPCN